MKEYRVVVAAHRVADVKAAGKAFKRRQKSGIFAPANFESKLNELAKEGWVVVDSNATSYLSDGAIYYALLARDVT